MQSQFPETISEEQQQPLLEIEAQKWDAHSFTIEGVNDELEKLLKECKIIRTFDLRNNGNEIRISRNVKLKSRKDLYLTPELETAAIENPLYQGSTFECEGLD